MYFTTVILGGFGQISSVLHFHQGNEALQALLTAHPVTASRR